MEGTLENRPRHSDLLGEAEGAQERLTEGAGESGGERGAAWGRLRGSWSCTGSQLPLGGRKGWARRRRRQPAVSKDFRPGWLFASQVCHFWL